MKTFKTALALIAALLLPLGLFASPSSAAPETRTPVMPRNLYQDVSTSDHTHLNPPFTKGQQIGIQANFDGGATTVTLYRKIGAGAWTSIDSKTSNSSGNAYFSYTVLGGDQQLFAETSGDVETEVDTIDGVIPPPPDGRAQRPDEQRQELDRRLHAGASPGRPRSSRSSGSGPRRPTRSTRTPGTPEKGPWVTIATATRTPLATSCSPLCPARTRTGSRTSTGP